MPCIRGLLPLIQIGLTNLVASSWDGKWSPSCILHVSRVYTLRKLDRKYLAKPSAPSAPKRLPTGERRYHSSPSRLIMGLQPITKELTIIIV